MKTKKILVSAFACAAATVFANQQPTSNDNPAYSQSNVQAQLRLNIREDAEAVHFIRDTSDPKIVTKTYVLKHADPYSIRPYLREMVQAQKVDYNNAAGRANPDYYNVYSKDNNAKTQKIFVPCGIECVKFTDGTGVLLVSAEEYRFGKNPGGMGIDELVEKLDQPGIMNSSGQPKFLYFPVWRSAAELRTMIRLVGANVSNDTVELIGGKDKIETDEGLNCLFLNTALYSRKNIEEMLRLYDAPYPEVNIRCTVYELDSENDGMLGVDFQNWKNNDGVRLLQTGADISRNWNLRDVANAVAPDGTVNTHYFNFQPKWNTKFLDFLVSNGKARVMTAGTLSIRNGATGKLSRTGGLIYAALEKIESKPGENEHGNSVQPTPANDRFRFTLEVTPSIAGKAASLSIRAATRSPLGYTSTGKLRSSDYESSQTVMLGNGKNRFYLGGIEKSETVRDSGGVPVLKDIPGLGWLFATERESVKKSRLVVIAECEVVRPDTEINPAELKKIDVIRKDTDSGKIAWGYRQIGLDAQP